MKLDTSVEREGEVDRNANHLLRLWKGKRAANGQISRLRGKLSKRFTVDRFNEESFIILGNCSVGGHNQMENAW